MGNSLEQDPVAEGGMTLARPPPASPKQGLSLWKAELAQGCFCALWNSEQGCERASACNPGQPGAPQGPELLSGTQIWKGPLGFTPTQMFFSLTEHFNRSPLRIFLHRQCCLQPAKN